MHDGGWGRRDGREGHTVECDNTRQTCTVKWFGEKSMNESDCADMGQGERDRRRIEVDRFLQGGGGVTGVVTRTVGCPVFSAKYGSQIKSWIQHAAEAVRSLPVSIRSKWRTLPATPATPATISAMLSAAPGCTTNTHNSRLPTATLPVGTP